MIIVKLKGGLGNQMFQYAAGRRLAVLRKTDLRLDISFLESEQRGVTPRTYELKHFNISASIMSPRDVTELAEKGMNLFQRFTRRLRRKLYLNNYLEPHFHFSPEVLYLPDNVLLDGYWQSYKYFEDIADIIGTELSCKEPLGREKAELAKIVEHDESVSVHIRRGDYIASEKTVQTYGACGLEYYLRATESLCGIVKKPHFIVFSDEPKWARANIKLPFTTTFVDNSDRDKSYEDLWLMSSCKHNIIANSSFSWWGAWLNNNPEKIVHAPKKWFNDSTIKTEDLFPQAWILI